MARETKDSDSSNSRAKAADTKAAEVQDKLRDKTKETVETEERETNTPPRSPSTNENGGRISTRIRSKVSCSKQKSSFQTNRRLTSFLVDRWKEGREKSVQRKYFKMLRKSSAGNPNLDQLGAKKSVTSEETDEQER